MEKLCFSQSTATHPSPTSLEDIFNGLHAMRVFSHSYWLEIFWTTISRAQCWRGRGDSIQNILEEKNTIFPEHPVHLYKRGHTLSTRIYMIQSVSYSLSDRYKIIFLYSWWDNNNGSTYHCCTLLLKMQTIFLWNLFCSLIFLSATPKFPNAITKVAYRNT